MGPFCCGLHPHASASRHVTCPWQIDLAYDILLMESMKRRLSGETEVARSVRFADVPQKKQQVLRGPAP